MKYSKKKPKSKKNMDTAFQMLDFFSFQNSDFKPEIKFYKSTTAARPPC